MTYADQTPAQLRETLRQKYKDPDLAERYFKPAMAKRKRRAAERHQAKTVLRPWATVINPLLAEIRTCKVLAAQWAKRRADAPQAEMFWRAYLTVLRTLREKLRLEIVKGPPPVAAHWSDWVPVAKRTKIEASYYAMVPDPPKVVRKRKHLFQRGVKDTPQRIVDPAVRARKARLLHWLRQQMTMRDNEIERRDDDSREYAGLMTERRLLRRAYDTLRFADVAEKIPVNWQALLTSDERKEWREVWRG